MVIEVLSGPSIQIWAENVAVKEGFLSLTVFPPKIGAVPIPEALFAIAPPSSSSENLRKNVILPDHQTGWTGKRRRTYFIKAVIQTQEFGKSPSRLFGRRPGVDVAMRMMAADLGVYDSFVRARR